MMVCSVDAPKTELWLLPGFMCDADLWRDQLTGLADIADCHVADFSAGNSIMELAGDILLRAGPTFALAGFSLGGYVAQEIIRQAAKRVERLALLDTSIRADTAERATMKKAFAASARFQGEFIGFSDKMLSTFVDRSRLDDLDLVDRIKAMTKRLGAEVYIRQNGMIREDGEAVVKSLRCPVLVLGGENDVLTGVPEQRELAGMIEGAHLVVVPGGGHMIPIEKPEEVTRALREWLLY
jgi:pimeloyl-ACP methyl ester carboxylesterase